MARAQRPRVYTAQIAIAVTPEMLADLREHAEAAGCSVADVVRDAIELATGTDLDQLLAVASRYLAAFRPDELMTLPERLRLQEIEDIVKRRGSAH